MKACRYHFSKDAEYVRTAQDILERDNCKYQCNHERVQHNGWQVQISQDTRELSGLYSPDVRRRA